MALLWLLEDPPQYESRGLVIMSILDGSGSAEVIPSRPDVSATPSDWDRGDRYDPDLDFDPNSYSRIDKFDGLEVGQSLIDSELDSRSSSGTQAEPETTATK